MEARNKRNASHTWRAILHGREALKKGLIKRMGDGNSIRIWEDPWVPESHDKRPLVRLPTTLVEELVDQENGGWDMQKLKANFVEPDVSMIARIPVGRAHEDFWSWFPDRFGNFSVRSAYKLMIELRRDVEAASSAGGPDKLFWKKLWRLPVPPKVRNFWWRVIKGFVPSKVVLCSRHIERIGFCEACGQEENVRHAIFECTCAKLFWQEIKNTTSIKVPALHPQTWAMDMVEGIKVQQAEACVILCGAWAVWTERNARTHGESSRSLIQSVKQWSTVTPKEKRKWEPPDQSYLKINVDATFDVDTHQGGTGLGVGDHESKLMRAQAIWYEHGLSAMTMESLAIRDGVQLALDLGYRKVIVETDAQSLVKLWSSPDIQHRELRTFS
jgi:hypothetical protein